MSCSNLGTLLTVTIFGESHGAAIRCMIDQCPPPMELVEVKNSGMLITLLE